MKLYHFFLVCLFGGISIGCKPENNTKIPESDTKTFALLDNEYLIKGQVFNKNNKPVYLYKIIKDSLIAIDTTVVDKNAFTFKGQLENPVYFAIKTDADSGSFRFLADASTINLFVHDKMINSVTYSNTEIQKEYREYVTKMHEFKDRGIDLYYNLKGNFSKTNIDKLKKGRSNLFKEQSDYLTDFIKTNNNSYFSALLIEDNYSLYHHKKLREFYSYLSPSIKEMQIAKQLDSNLIALESATKIIDIKESKSLTMPKTTEYRPSAYSFSGLNPQGQTMSLASIPKGKVVLLDFWASWCGPCRASNPSLVALYNKYNSKGFEIMSISEDKGEAEWINAIYADNLTWNYHVLDKNKSIAFRYGVESIPFKILIDKNGKIASGKISGVALERRIQQLLAE